MNAKSNVLAIHSYHNEHIWTGFIKEGIDGSFDKQEGAGLFHEYMDVKRYPEMEYEQSFLNYLKEKYKNTPIDVLLVSDDAALQMILDHREEFFSDVPVIYMGINQVSQSLIDTAGMSGVFENRDLARTVLDIKKITQSDELIVITDRSAPGLANVQKIKTVIGDPRAPSKLHIIDQLQDDQVVKTLQEFPPETPILLIGQMISTSQNNALLSWNAGTQLITNLTTHPVFTIAITTVDYGATGAHELYGSHHAEKASALARQVLQGVPIDTIEPITIAESEWIIDAQRLKQYGYDQSNLPSDSVIRNQDVSFYAMYKRIVWLVSAAFFMSLLIIILLIKVVQRGRNTQQILLENEMRYRDLALAGANIFWETDKENRFSYISGDTKLLFSRQPEDVIGKTLAEIYENNPDVDFPWGSYNRLLNSSQAIDDIVFKIKLSSDDVQIFIINGKKITSDNFVGYRGIFKEITQEHKLSQKIAYQATYDSLTGLINRDAFNARMKNYVSQVHDVQKNSFVCFLDLDRFKFINDTAGHLVGDGILTEIAALIKSCISHQDILGRLGGDEFGLMLLNKSQADAQLICEAIIQQVVKYQFHWNQRFFNVGISVGMVPIDPRLTEIELLSKADLSCYKAKELGRGRVYIANLDNNDLYDEELQMGYIANVTYAIEKNQFYLAKQLIQPMREEQVNYEHYEILIRYQDENGKLIPPDLFIPIAEKHGVITLIDQWVITTVCERYNEFFPDKNTMVSINLSGVSLSNDEFVSNLVSIIKSCKIRPELICFEITETAAISHLSHALDFIQQMKVYGVKFALDDFGSGASSFGYLKNIPVDYLKIDGSLIRNIVTESTDRAIVESIHSIARMMNIKTIAEFVEDDDIYNVLDEIGVCFAQGYGVGMPERC